MKKFPIFDRSFGIGHPVAFATIGARLLKRMNNQLITPEMEKSNFLRGGEMNAPYASPQLELLEIATEQGFNLSDKYLYDNGGLSDGEWDESNY